MSFANPDAAITAAIEHHRAGRLQQAEQIYREILAGNPNHAAALNLLGALAHQVGRSEVGAQLISRAIQCGASGEAYNNLGECLRAMGKYNEAIAAYQTAIRLLPNQSDAYSNLGMLLNSGGRFNDALPLLEKAIALNPNSPNAHYNYGITLENLRRADDAIEQWEMTLRQQPNHVLALNMLGSTLIRRERIERAIMYLQRAIEISPGFAEAHANLGHALSIAERYDEAIAEAKKAIDLEPNRAEAYNTLGVVLLQAERYDQAIAATKKALELNPKFHKAQGNLGGIYQQLDQHDKAIEAFEVALKLSPTDIDTFTALYGSYYKLRQPQKSLEIADRALLNHPNHAEFHGNRALALLAVGRYPEGWEEYEWRWHCTSFTSPPRDFDRPMWDGSNPAGRTILVHGEQGFGDVIQFSRYVPLLQAQGAKVIIEVQSSLRMLMQSLSPDVRVVPKGLKLPDFDLHVPLMSLPRAFGTTLETIPQNVPYLHAEPARIEKWRPRVQGEGMKIGLVWGGNLKPDPRRTCPLTELAPLINLPNISWFSLQTGNPRDDLKSAPQSWHLPDLGVDLKDFADTASVMSLLDRVLTIDTSAAHLAGAMGIKTWTMLPYAADWRWLLEGETTPWYPTMRLFRQAEFGEWEGVVAQIKEELVHHGDTENTEN